MNVVRQIASVESSLACRVDNYKLPTRNLQYSRLFSSNQENENDGDESDDYSDVDDTETECKGKLEGLTFKDFDMSYLRDLVERGELNLQPFYQRGFKWTQKQASMWIESTLRGYPCVPEIILLTVMDEDGEQKSVVFDGQQRLTSTILFMKNQRGISWPTRKNDDGFRLEQLPLLKEFDGKRYQDLPKKEQNAIKHFGVRCAIIPASWEMSDYIDFFKRIQGGGTPMTDQELRRALSQGPFTELLDQLSRNNVVLRTLEGFPKYQPGSDDLQELLLRYFQYQHFRERFGKPTLTQNGLETMKYFNREMKTWTGENFPKREQLIRPLLKSLDLISHIFESNEAFRRPRPLIKKGRVITNGAVNMVWVDDTRLKQPVQSMLSPGKKSFNRKKASAKILLAFAWP